MVDPSQMLTVEQVARRLAITEETIRRWLRSGRLRGVRLGATRAGWRVTEVDLAAFLHERANMPAEGKAAA
jgi:excisionase family DNA binding protein